MLKKERQAYIIQQINIHNKVLSSDLCEQLQVSEDTVRRDLQELSEQGRVTKVHGGALSRSFQFSLEEGDVYSLGEKRKIALKAASLIHDGMFVLLAGGTTIRELVKALPDHLNATFITVSLPTAMELLNHPNIEVILLGNRILKQAQIAVGADVVTRLGQIRADLCFLGTNSIDAEQGITDLEWEVIEVKRAMIKAAQQTVFLAISEKLNSVQKLQVCPIEELDILVTELDTTDERLDRYRAKKVQLI